MTRMQPSLRLQRVQTPIIPVVGEWIRANPGAISLGQGVVYYGPPPEAAEALTAFWDDPDNHKYKLVQGIPPLLKGLEEKLRTENRIALDGSNALLVTGGGNLAFMNALLAVADPGDEVILQTPYYFNHEMAIVMAGCRPVCVPCDKNHQPQVDAIRARLTPKTKAVVTISPNNPTGAVYPEEVLREINALCGEKGLYHIHDEAYEYFTYNGAVHFSPASISGSSAHTISLFSLSKAYGFASWRIGYMVFPAPLLEAIKKIQDTILICPPVISQFAAVGALKAGRQYCERKLPVLQQSRRRLIESLAELSDFVMVPPADGAFYLLLKIQTPLNPMELVRRLVFEYKVAAMPGGAFGIENGCYLRVAFGALQTNKAEEGIARLVRGLKQIAGAKEIS